jgi:hypothetical protein
MKIPGLTTLGRVLRALNPLPLVRKANPVPVVEKEIVNALIQDLIKKFLSSGLKSVATALIGALTLTLGAPAPSDQTGALLWTLFLVGIRAAISALTQFVQKYQAAQALKALAK